MSFDPSAPGPTPALPALGSDSRLSWSSVVSKGLGEGAGQQYVDLAPDGLFPPQFCQTSRVTEQASLPLCAPSSRIYKMGFTGLLLSC